MLAWMRLATARDDQRIRQVCLATRLKLHDRNRQFWQARSYSPTLYRGARDAWYA
ncbi:VirB3 family type IV secretion system protein [Ideonella sp. A 288]|uniref:VirB3 family type IV secretion system protein n=1 Tax=Ideonella sp. A 288 TaxID=1962181 RepID=UPI0021013F71|nr:VirB3 family type IV secretion system protein [Ideonella sp. A 288]